MSEPAARPSRPGRLLAAPAALLWGVLLAISGLFLAAYLAVAGLRFAYPYHLEWMEGGVLHHVRWILDGHPLYGRPGLLFTPYTYPPLYFYVAAGAARLLGAGLPALRLVSILSSLGCFALLYRMALLESDNRESGSRGAGLLAAGFFAATFRAAGSWLDLARVDSLFLLLLLGSVHLLRSGASPGAALAAGALLALSALTKQTALVVAVPLLLGALALSPRRALVAGGAFAGLFGASTLALDLFHGGWYRFYVFDLPAELPFLGLPLSRFLRRDLLSPLAVALPLAVLYLVWQAVRKEGRRAVLFHGAAALGMAAAAYAGRNKVGGFLNALLPAYAYVALLAALAVVGLRRELGAFASMGATARRAALGRLAEAAVYLLAILQLGLLAYDPRGQLPSASDRRAGDELVAKLRAAQGEVLLPEFGYLAGLAGKTVYAHSVATWDVMAGRDRKPGAALLAEMKRAMREDRFAAILFAQEGWDGPDWFGPDLRGYVPVRLAYRPLPREARPGAVLSRGARWAQRRDAPRPPELAGADVFLPLTGYQLRPMLLYRPRRP